VSPEIKAGDAAGPAGELTSQPRSAAIDLQAKEFFFHLSMPGHIPLVIPRSTMVLGNTLLFTQPVAVIHARNTLRRDGQYGVACIGVGTRYPPFEEQELVGSDLVGGEGEGTADLRLGKIRGAIKPLRGRFGSPEPRRYSRRRE